MAGLLKCLKNTSPHEATDSYCSDANHNGRFLALEERWRLSMGEDISSEPLPTDADWRSTCPGDKHASVEMTTTRRKQNALLAGQRCDGGRPWFNHNDGRSASPVVGKSRIVRQSKDGLAGWCQPVIPTGISSFMLSVHSHALYVSCDPAVRHQNKNAAFRTPIPW